jgi:hypothetical protein
MLNVSNKYIMAGRRDVITLVFDTPLLAEQFCKSDVFKGYRDIKPEINEDTVYVHHQGGINFALWFKSICDNVTRLPAMPCDTYRFETA